MTVELGNINKGIPMGSYTPDQGGGGGGGGTTTVTGVAPIKVTNGSVSLKIDGQTLQVNSDGELAANLDELGNEVNDIAGDVTALQADILKKEDKFEATAPLAIQEEIPAAGLELQTSDLSYNNDTGILSINTANADLYAKIDLTNVHIKTHEPYTLHLRAARYATGASGNSNFFRLNCFDEGSTYRGVRVWNRVGSGAAGATSTAAKALQLNSTDYVHYEFRFDGTKGYSEYRGRNNGDDIQTTPLAINTYTDQAGTYSTFEDEFVELLLNCYSGYAGKFDLSQSYFEQDGVKYILKDIVDGISRKLVVKTGSGISVVDGALTATSSTPTNMVTTNTTQVIAGRKILNTSNDKYLLQIQGDSKIKCSFGYDSASGAALIETSNNGGLEIVQPDSTKSFKYNNGTTKYDILHTGNLASNLPTATTSAKGLVKPDGSTITITDDGTISAVGGGGGTTTYTEKYGIEGDYSSKYGILECPNGIFKVSGMTMTLQPGVVMQCAGLDTKTTNSSAMAHTVESTTDFDIFYTSGQFIEATSVSFSTVEPDDGDTGYIAWWDPSRTDKQWQFKSNSTGNVWAAAPACRLAHVHTDGTTITRVDYIGNRQMDDGVFADVSADNTFSGANTFDKLVLPSALSTKGIFLEGNTSASIYGFYGSLVMKDLTNIFTENCTVSGGILKLGDYKGTGAEKVQALYQEPGGTTTKHVDVLTFNNVDASLTLGNSSIPLNIEGSAVKINGSPISTTDGGSFMPDYTAGVAITTGWVATYDCWGYCEAKKSDNATFNVTVDGVRVAHWYTGAYPKECTFWWLVPKGSTVAFTGSFDVSPKVYPMKGASNA